MRGTGIVGIVGALRRHNHNGKQANKDAQRITHLELWSVWKVLARRKRLMRILRTTTSEKTERKFGMPLISNDCARERKGVMGNIGGSLERRRGGGIDPRVVGSHTFTSHKRLQRAGSR